MIATLQALAQNGIVDTLGWVLLHFLWQGTIVVALTAAILRLLARQRPEARYGVACGALVGMLLLPAVTFVILHGGNGKATPVVAGTEESAALLSLDEPLFIDSVARWQGGAEAALPIVVSIWIAGVLFLSFRLFSGLVAVEILARRTTELPDAVRIAANRLAARLGVHAAVRFVRSAAVEVPTVIGWLRPVVLVPASAITGLTPQQLETLLAHELAHIRRYDYFVNLLQSVVETVLFYHPGVWWISRQIRIERENCCDDIVVELYEDRLLYARALTDLEMLRSAPAALALGATGGSLRDRIRRLVNGRNAVCSQRGRASTAVLLALLMMVLVPASLAAREVGRHLETIRSFVSLSPGEAAGIVIDVLAEAISDSGRRESRSEPVAITADPSLTVVEPPATDSVPMVSALASTAAPSARATRDEEIDRAIQRKLFGITEEYRQEIAAAGYDLTEDQLAEFRIHRVTPEFIESMNASGMGRLSPRQLVELRIHGVTPAYIRSIRAAGYDNLSPQTIGSFRIHGVTPELIQSLHRAGVRGLSAQQLLEFAIHGVTPDFILALHESGVGTLRPNQLVAFRIHRVTPEFVREMNAVAGRKLSEDELLELRIHGVTADQVSTMRQMFGRQVALQDIIAMKIHGVSPTFITAMRSRGYELGSPQKAVELRIHGVTPQFIDELHSLGLRNLTPDQLVQMRIFRIDAEYVRRLHDAGVEHLTVEQMIRLQNAGIDPSELARQRR